MITLNADLSSEMNVSANPVGTKIMATLGPATCSAEGVRALVDAGVNVIRLNFSHGSLKEHQQTLENIRAVMVARQDQVAIVGDLCGPKTRVGTIENGKVLLRHGDSIRIVVEKVIGNTDRISINQPEVLLDVEIGHRILIDDGNVRLHVIAKDNDGLTCTCAVGGEVSNNKGMNFPDSDTRLASLTERDIENARWACQVGLDYIALSFVRTADDVKQLRQILADLQVDIHIISKIETPQAVRNIDTIIDVSDAILVARGDLGVEMNVEQVPFLQKDIIRRCRRAGKPVIVATQMLQSMVNSPVPTRAEASDVANAIIDGADTVMLSAETAVGQYPTEAVQLIRRIAVETEAYDQEHQISALANADCPGISSALALATSTIVDQLNARAVVLWTQSGSLARAVSKHRLDRPVLAITPCESSRRRMALYYGTTARLAERPINSRDEFKLIDNMLIDEHLAQPGSLIVISVSPTSLECGDTGSISVHACNTDQGKDVGS